MIKIGILGYGYWGKNLVRNFYYLDGCRIEYVCEKNENNANKCSSTYPNINVVNDVETLFNDQNVDAIVIATPVDGIDFNLEHKSKFIDKNTNETCFVL